MVELDGWRDTAGVGVVLTVAVLLADTPCQCNHQRFSRVTAVTSTATAIFAVVCTTPLAYSADSPAKFTLALRARVTAAGAVAPA